MVEFNQKILQNDNSSWGQRLHHIIGGSLFIENEDQTTLQGVSRKKKQSI